MSRLLLMLGLVLALLSAALGLLYWQLPTLAARYAPELARAYGVELDALELEHPGFAEVHVLRLAGRAGTVSFEARDVDVSYRLEALTAGELTAVRAAAVELRVLAADAVPTPSAAGAGSEPALTPAALFAALPAERVEIDALRVAVPAVDFTGRGSAVISAQQAMLELVGETPEQAAGLGLRGELAADGRFEVELRGRDSSEPVPVTVEGLLHGDRVELSGALELTGYPLRLAAAVLNAPAGDGRVVASFRSVEAVALEDFHPEALSLEGIFEVDWASQELALALRGAAGRWSLREGVVQTTFSGGGVYYEDAETSIDAVLPDGLTASLADERLSFGPGVRATLKTGDLDATARLTAGTVLLAEPLRMEGGATVTAETLGYGLESQLELTTVLEGDVVTVAGSATVGGLEFPLRGEHDLDSGWGRVESTSSFALQAPLAASLVTSWPNDYDLDAGNVALATEFRWSAQDPAKGRVQLTVTEGLARYGEDRVEGVAGTFDLHIDDGEVVLLPAQVRADRADLGVLLESLEATVAFSGDSVEVRGAAAAILGGRATAAPFSYALSTGSAELAVTLEALSLADILALVGDDIRGEGSLSGTLPVKLAADVPSIRDGSLMADEPGGVIRVAPDFAALTGQPGLDFALAALTDYRFETLEATVSYTEDGELTLGVSLEGVNPEVEKGRPIHYNLNITQNVLVLLKSLRAQRVVTERLEKRVLN